VIVLVVVALWGALREDALEEGPREREMRRRLRERWRARLDARRAGCRLTGS
jgi:hypothetical protein